MNVTRALAPRTDGDYAEVGERLREAEEDVVVVLFNTLLLKAVATIQVLRLCNLINIAM
jgi:hypothetical protein